MFENMVEALVGDERIEIRGFGSFKVKGYKGYKGRNPKTGDLIEGGGQEIALLQGGQRDGGTCRPLSF